MQATLATIPLQFVIQLIVPGNIENGNTTLALGPPFFGQTPELPEGYTAFPDIGMAYKYNGPVLVTWNEARRLCAADGASLAVLDSYKKCQYVKGLKGEDNIRVWVGIHRYFDDGEWVSVKTGLPVGTIPWKPNGSYQTEEDRKCICMHGDGTGVGADLCNWHSYYVCEIEIPRLEQLIQELKPN